MEQIFEFLEQIIFTIGDVSDENAYHFRVSNLLYVSIVLAAAIFIFKKYKQLIVQLAGKFELDEKEQKTINRAFRIILFWITVVLFFQSVGFPIEKITDFQVYSYDCETIPNPDFVESPEDTKENPKNIEQCSHFRLSNIINSIIVFFIFRIIVWTIIHLLGGYYRREQMDKGSQYAINRLIKYFIYTVMVLTIIETLGFQLTVLWGAAGALLVGFGLGLQQTFNDLFSGVLIMIEGTVHVGDMVRVKGEIGRITKIGIRASEVRMRDDVELIVPNSHLVMDGLANWNHSDQKARFFVTVGVAYGSDTQMIKKILLEIAAKQSKIIDYPEPFVRFVDFGNSSLDFQLHFWTFEVFNVPDIQSDLRFEIDKAFRENKVEIPFPQRDLWVRNPNDLK